MRSIVKYKCRPANDESLLQELQNNSAADEELAKFAKALGHPARVRILRILAGQDGCICGDVVAELPLAQSTVSQHLKILKEAGLIQGEVDGPRVRYCIARPAVDQLKALVQNL
jgi:ArsR family transcriptional regulator, arsenate/arsenite/antimonite-responsive transcriptional repressor